MHSNRCIIHTYIHTYIRTWMYCTYCTYVHTYIYGCTVHTYLLVDIASLWPPAKHRITGGCSVDVRLTVDSEDSSAIDGRQLLHKWSCLKSKFLVIPRQSFHLRQPMMDKTHSSFRPSTIVEICKIKVYTYVCTT